MLEKYLNKKVIIEEKLYNSSSTVSKNGMAKLSYLTQNRISGILTGIEGNYIELDNNTLILAKHIYRIILK